MSEKNWVRWLRSAVTGQQQEPRDDGPKRSTSGSSSSQASAPAEDDPDVRTAIALITAITLEDSDAFSAVWDSVSPGDQRDLSLGCLLVANVLIASIPDLCKESVFRTMTAWNIEIPATDTGGTVRVELVIPDAREVIAAFALSYEENGNAPG